MVGQTLSKIRARIESLASEEGEYYVVCGRTGTRPVPVADKRFPDRDAAEEAAQTATAYRAALRRYDPRAPVYDFIACEAAARGSHAASVLTRVGATGEAPSLTGFCHDVAGAVFEALSTAGYSDLESTIMDCYCEAADAIEDPDELCLHLLRTLALELDDRLSADEQAQVLERAAREVPDIDATEEPLASTFDRLAAVDLVDEYSITAQPDATVGRQSWTVRLENYALAGSGDPLPTLPIALDLLRRLPNAALTLSRAHHHEDGSWTVRLTATEDGEPAGLFGVPTDATA